MPQCTVSNHLSYLINTTECVLTLSDGNRGSLEWIEEKIEGIHNRLFSSAKSMMDFLGAPNLTLEKAIDNTILPQVQLCIISEN